jgi:hypothetical protein
MHWRTTVGDAEAIVERLRSIEEDLRDLAYERLRAAAEEGDVSAAADERRVLQARRAIERALSALAALSGQALPGGALDE